MKILTFKGGKDFLGPLKWPLAKFETFRGGWDFFGPLNGTSDSEGHFGAKKVEAPSKSLDLGKGPSKRGPKSLCPL